MASQCPRNDGGGVEKPSLALGRHCRFGLRISTPAWPQPAARLGPSFLCAVALARHRTCLRLDPVANDAGTLLGIGWPVLGEAVVRHRVGFDTECGHDYPGCTVAIVYVSSETSKSFCGCIRTHGIENKAPAITDNIGDDLSKLIFYEPKARVTYRSRMLSCWYRNIGDSR